MRTMKLATLALAASSLLSTVSVAPASAMSPAKPIIATGIVTGSTIAPVRFSHGGGGFSHSGGNFHGGGFGHHGFGHRGFYFGGPAFYADDYYYGGDGGGCYWMKRRALNTGSGYWWRRYNDCRWG